LNYTVVGIGEIVWDVFPEGTRLGGAPANFALDAAALGHNGIVASRIGEDEAGRKIRKRFDSRGLEARYLQYDGEHPTGTVDVELGENGVPSFTIHENAAWDYLEFTPDLAALAPKTDAVCFGTLAQRAENSRSTIQRFVADTPETALRILDVNLRQLYYDTADLKTSLELANVAKLSVDEWETLTAILSLPEAKQESIAALAETYGLRAVAITRSERGSVLYQGGEFFQHAGVSVDVVDTVGAGDAFTAALAVGLLEGRSPEDTNDFANRVASYVCSQAGATPDLSELAEG
jgi:fructokinase